MRRSVSSAVAVAVAVTVLGACTDAGDDDATTTTTTTEPPVDAAEEQESLEPGDIAVAMTGVDGTPLGAVTLRHTDAGTRVRADLQGLTPGFHGFHVHDVGVCEADAPDGPFTTATGHYVGDGSTHGDHDGDMPSLYVTEDGKTSMTVALDAFTVEELTEGDGTALIVHAAPDNFGYVPDRYTASDAEAPGPDQTTTSTGDAGARVACGVVEPAQG